MPGGRRKSNRTYHQWLKENEDHLPVPKSTIEEILKENKPSN